MISYFGTLAPCCISLRHLRILDLEESDDMEDCGGPWPEFLQKGEGILASLNMASPGLEEKNIKESLRLLAPRLESMSSLRVSDMDLDSFFKILDYSVVPVIELGLGCRRNWHPRSLTGF